MTVDPLIGAIHDHRLPDRARRMIDDPDLPDADRARAGRALAACERIGEQMADLQGELVALARRAGLRVRTGDRVGPRQNHTVQLFVDDFDTADAVAELLAQEGFERWERRTGGALESFRRVGEQMTLARTGDVSAVVRVAWADRGRRGRLSRAIRPTAADWDMVDLPAWAWPAYSIVRPVRLIAERAGLRRRHHASIGPFLATPDSLIDALLDFGDVRPDDCVMDIGCGDGRLPVAAAARRGCRALGVERSSDLVRRARARADAAGVGDLVGISEGDARSADLSEVTVAFMFLPTDVVGELLADTLRRLPPGARLIVHEQNRLPASLDGTPAKSSALVTDGAVTVAHQWVATTGSPLLG